MSPLLALLAPVVPWWRLGWREAGSEESLPNRLEADEGLLTGSVAMLYTLRGMAPVGAVGPRLPARGEGGRIGGERSPKQRRGSNEEARTVAPDWDRRLSPPAKLPWEARAASPIARPMRRASVVLMPAKEVRPEVEPWRGVGLLFG